MDGVAQTAHPADHATHPMLVKLFDRLTGLHRAALAGTYLTFQSGGEPCGLRVLQLKKVAHLPSLHPLPGAPKYVLGTVPVDGLNIPVIDLRLKMQMRLPASPEQDQQHLVFAYVQRLDGEFQLVGVAVDRVDELVEFAAEEIRPGFQPSVRISPDFVLGRAVNNGQSVTLLALDHIIPPALVTQLVEKLISMDATTVRWSTETLSSFRLN